MPNMRAKLLIPLFLITSFCFAVIGYISFQQYINFQTTAAQLTKALQDDVENLLARLQEKNREPIAFLANDWRFIDNITVGNINRLLDNIVPFRAHRNFDLLNVYDTKTDTLACADTPGRFGHPDELQAFVTTALGSEIGLAVATIYNGRPILVGLQRIVNNFGPVGVLAVGTYLDQETIDHFDRSHIADLHFYLAGKEVLSSTGKKSETLAAKRKTTSFTFAEQIDASGALSARIIENISPAEQVFAHRLLKIIIIFTVASAFVIHLSRKLIYSVANSLDLARKSAETTAAELRQAKQELEIRVHEKTKDLSASEQRYREVVEGTVDLITQVDHEGKFLYVNHVGEKILGVERDKLIGMSYFDFIHPADQKHCRRQLTECLQHKLSQATRENRLVNKATGKVSYMLWSSRFHYDEHGQLLKINGIAHDITERIQAEGERKRLEEQLRQANKMEAIGTLAGGIAHDFNNMLNAIIGYANLLIDKLPAQDETQLFAREIKNAGKRAADLVEHILTFSRRTEHKRQPLQLQSLVKETLKLLHGTLPATINLQENINPRCEHVLADATQIHQIIMNLCTNAYHAMRETGGTLEVELDMVDVDPNLAILIPNIAPGRHVRLTVRDSGHGMDIMTQERIFEPYFTTKRAGEGTGLGLATVHGIVESHHGGITVASTIGKGTTFQVYLPTCSETTSPREVAPAEAAIPQCRCTALFIDDLEVNVILGKHLLERLGCTVIGMTKSPEALAAFTAAPDHYGIVITDQTMPEMTGFELAKKMLAIRPDLPIIMVTGHSDIVNEQKAKSIGIRDFLMKPLDPALLAAAVSRAVNDQALINGS